jgi:TolB-like protein
VLGAFVVVALLAGGGYFGWRYLGAQTSKQIESIAVMPFVNEGGDPEIEYLADGMTESLIGSLSQVPNLNVKARSSVFRFKGKDADVRTLGRELNVQAILSGRLVPRGGEVALYLELIDAATENVIFKANYLQPLDNLVSLQRNVAHDVSSRLSAKLTAAQQGEVEKSHTQNPEAYRLYLQGRYHWNKRLPEEHQKAISLFQQAIALDPAYALAYAGLADCYAVDSSPVKGEEAARLIRQAANKAIELDPTLGQPRASLANTYWNEFNWAAAERELQLAIELEPNYATAHQWYGELLSRLGRHDEAVAKLRKARELDPLSLIIASDTIYVLAFARRYDEALAQADRTLEMDPAWRQGWILKGFVYELRGDLAAALDIREEGLKPGRMDPERTKRLTEQVRQLRQALQSGGSEAYWRLELSFELAKDRVRPGEFSPFYIAEIYAAMNEKDEAFRWLNKAIDEKDDFVDGTKVVPSLDNLRSDPRWPQVLARLNFL